MKKVRIIGKEPCLIINRGAFHDNKLVYVLLANRRVRYKPYDLRSRIVYIGTTKRGADRFAVSAVERGRDVLFRHGIHQIKVYTVTCQGARGVKTWRKLEDAFLYNFREYYGCKPLLNKQCGPRRKEDVATCFQESKIEKIIKHFSNLKER